jgi:pimeloyl-ACP methyl ester carboxylesterase
VHVTFVLVHGGGFSGSCWDELCPLLAGQTLAVDLPGRGRNQRALAAISVHDFVASVATEIVDNDLTNVTLVGHSMAGLTLPGVAEAVPDRLRRLVFVSCSVPPNGTSLAEVLVDLSPTVKTVVEGLGDQVVDQRGTLHPDVATAMFCTDMDATQTASTLGRLVPEAVSVLSEPADLTGLRRPIPRTYVRLTLDASISINAQNRMIANLGTVDVVDLEAGHMAMISRPHELADVLNRL